MFAHHTTSKAVCLYDDIPKTAPRAHILFHTNTGKRLPQMAHINRERIVIDKLIRLPKLFLNALTGHNGAGVAHQNCQYPQLVFG